MFWERYKRRGGGSVTRGGDCTINEDAWEHPYQKIVTDGDS